MARKTTPKRSTTGCSAKKTQPIKTTTKAKAQRSAKPAKADGKRAISTDTPPSLEQLHLRAYEIWLHKGQPTGQDQQNWFEAEAELLQSPR